MDEARRIACEEIQRLAKDAEKNLEISQLKVTTFSIFLIWSIKFALTYAWCISTSGLSVDGGRFTIYIYRCC